MHLLKKDTPFEWDEQAQESLDAFAYQKMPFGLKNARATFQWAMTLIFHDLNSIIEVFWMTLLLILA